VNFKIGIHLQNPSCPEENLDLFWEVLSTPPAALWLKLLFGLANRKEKIFPRFSGFKSETKNFKSLAVTLQNCIDTINIDGRYVISEKVPTDFTQDFANAIHHHFETLIGPIEKPTKYFITSTRQVMQAVMGLNHCIHDMEALSKNLNSDEDSMAGLITEIASVPRYPLPEDFYQYFQLPVQFGDMLLHYCQLGKTWLEVYFDRDEEATGVLPLKHINGEFDVFFGTYEPDEKEIENLHLFLKNKGLNPEDPKLALGHCPVARFCRPENLTNKEIKSLIEKHLQMNELSFWKDGNHIQSMTCDSPFYSYAELKNPEAVL